MPAPPPVVDCVSFFRSASNRSESELEVRLGHWDAQLGRFTPGIPKASFVHLERELCSTADLEADKEWEEVVDYYYTSKDKSVVRTRVECDTTTMSMSNSHIVKRGTFSSVLLVDEETGDACKACWCMEVPVHDPPGVCIPSHVRIKQRKSFRDARGGGVVWKYELSKTWSASSRSAVEHMQHVQEPVYEVECELVDEGGEYLREREDSYVAHSLLAKTLLLLGEGPTRCDEMKVVQLSDRRWELEGKATATGKRNRSASK